MSLPLLLHPCLSRVRLSLVKLTPLNSQEHYTTWWVCSQGCRPTLTSLVGWRHSPFHLEVPQDDCIL